VLDPFTGTTGLAALQLGRRFTATRQPDRNDGGRQ
jgi:hypothetical protein